MHGRRDVGHDVQRVVRVQGLSRSAHAMRHGYAMFWRELYAQEEGRREYNTNRGAGGVMSHGAVRGGKMPGQVTRYTSRPVGGRWSHLPAQGSHPRRLAH